MTNLIMAFALFATEQNNFEFSNTVLNIFYPNKSNSAEYYYIKTINYFSLNQKKLAEEAIHLFENSFYENEPPSRYYAIIHIIKNEIDDWKPKGLGDIQRYMKLSKDRLDNAKGGKITQKIQEDILKKLDDMIKEKEEQKSSASNDNNKQQLPKNDSSPANENITIPKEIEKELKNVAKNWVKLNEKERADAINSITREMPLKYRKIIEDYFIALSKN